MEAAADCADLGMILKIGHRFSEEIMPSQHEAANMIQPGWIMFRAMRSD
jgi:hypothetical protein